MNDLTDLLALDAVLERVSVASKKALFQQVAGVAASVYGLDAAAVAEALTAREKLGSTGFGGGVATPHGKLAGLSRVVGVFARLGQPLDFAAVDDLPVDLVFVLLSPSDVGGEHLKALARVSRALRDRALVAKLRGAGSRDALFALLSENGLAETGVRDAA